MDKEIRTAVHEELVADPRIDANDPRQSRKLLAQPVRRLGATRRWRVWQDFPVWGLCLYDTATSPAEVLDAAERTHPRIVSPSGARRANGRFQKAADFEALPPVPDPLEQTTPMIELAGRSAAEARRALVQIGGGRVAGTILDDLLLGVSEAVSNAQIHGRAPATVRIWAAPDRIVIGVHDQGRGPADPLAGLVPAARNAATPGLGLWLIHQLGIDVALRHADDGFTVRLRGGTTIG
jgi:anti-sigma regulatory factor (Ser/Thr protein kinase)